MKYIFSILVIILLVGIGFYYFRLQKQAEEDTLPPPQPIPAKEVNGNGIEQKLEDVTTRIETLAKDFDSDVPFVVHRVWVEDGKFYVEYENKNAALGQIFVIQEGGAYKGIGYFSPSESGWALQAGEGEVVGPSASLYEKDKKGHWIKKN